MKRLKKTAILILMLIVTAAFAACGPDKTGGNDPQPLSAEEFSFYADNINVFADDVLDSGAKFLYVQLGCSAEDLSDAGSGTDAEVISIADNNADGICGMIQNDYHEVLDMRMSTDDITEAVMERLGLPGDAAILVIGDEAGEALVYEKLVDACEGLEYRSSICTSDDSYDEIYSHAIEGGFDAVIVANDAAAFHDGSFPFAG